jgi:hypothetical protein
VIENAANRQLAHVRSFQHGPNAACSQQLLNELTRARLCLLNVDEKAAYDRHLGSQLGRAVVAAVVLPMPISVAALDAQGKRKAQSAMVLIVWIATGGVFSIALVIFGLQFFVGIDALADLTPMPAPGGRAPPLAAPPVVRRPPTDDSSNQQHLSDSDAPPSASQGNGPPDRAPMREVPEIKSESPPDETAAHAAAPKGDLPFKAGDEWVGIGVHTSGPAAGKEFNRMQLKIKLVEGGGFYAWQKWESDNVGGLVKGENFVTATGSADDLKWTATSDVAGSAWLRDGVLFVKWKQKPYAGEHWYVPAETAKTGLHYAGKYRVLNESGGLAFELTLRDDGSATKSQSPMTKGAWLGSSDRLLVVWTDGRRDVLEEEDGVFKRSSYGMGKSFRDEPSSTGGAEKLP